ncbi:hypothetical protein [Marinospirillum perlucidum]|uniref:hypothetical protein n=1 Tax=Marinospirillum perlucidum TaxID=1982602 RepID=UPI000DF486CF|nr:hypothetical protein [Marinospirillum perlucidum]
MKLRHALAGTVALPLALAVASSANAATIVDNDEQTFKVGGFVQAQHVFGMYDADTTEDDHGMELGVSRLNFTHTKKTDAGDITIFYENDFRGTPTGSSPGYRLRHAVIKYDGWTAGYTWSFFSNLNGLGETIDHNGNAVRSAATNRNPVLGKTFTLADGMSVGVSLEDRGSSDAEMMPDITVNFNGNFGGIGVFAAAQNYAIGNGAAATTETRITGSVAVPAGPATVKAAFTQDVDDMWVTGSAQFRATETVRANLVVEQAMMDADDSDYTALFVNAIYTTPVGLEWGAEVGTVSADASSGGPLLGSGGNSDGDMTVRLQARYAF